MGNILNPGRENSFTRLVKSRKTEIFIDKTDFLEVMSSKINDEKRFFAVTRPRRFGKTVTAHMLSAYFSKGYAGRNIFDSLEITHKDSFPEHLNKYDVIYIDMNSINSRYNNYLKNEKVPGVASLADYLEYSIITELREQQNFAACFEKHNIKNTGLLVALSSLQNDLNAQFIFIMDEWDLVCREYRNNEQLQKDYIDLLKDLFKTDDGQACFVLAYLTGILPIKKYNSQSALNTFLEYNMLEPEPFERYFGFTEAETAEIAARPSCKLTQEELKDWYEGYKLNGIDIYNPNSVVSAVKDGKCKSYWSRSSSNEEVAHLINMDYAGVKSDILNLIEGGRAQFDTSNFQNDMVSINSKDDVLCLLACLGYVGCESVKNSDVLKIAYVPNKEIRSVLTGIVRKQNWYERMDTIERSENLLKAIKARDGNKTAGFIQEIHNSPAVSLLDYNDEESLTYCVMTGLLWSTLDDYTYHREEQAGKGKVDLVYEPNIKGAAPLILIEFKYGKSAEEALKQIKTQEYFRRYTKLYTKNILLVGINYDPKSKNHQCLIEKLN